MINGKGGDWPNDSYFKKWEIHNANTDTQSNSEAILNELNDVRISNNKKSFNQLTMSRKYDISHLIAKFAVKEITLSEGNLATLLAAQNYSMNKDITSGLGVCNTILPLSFDHIPNETSKMIAGIDFPGNEEHYIVLKKNDDTLNLSGYEYLNKEPELKNVIQEAINLNKETYKTTFIIAQIYKRAKMDISGNITYLDL
tara:strand:- start:2647 stop:3243 length:597 start_codon:yes stop_codon:yes gene_type:complete